MRRGRDSPRFLGKEILMAHLLVVDDEQNIRTLIRKYEVLILP